jgi:hypothetical protein
MAVTCDGLATFMIASEERLRRLLRNWAVMVWMAFGSSVSKSDSAGRTLVVSLEESCWLTRDLL